MCRIRFSGLSDRDEAQRFRQMMSTLARGADGEGLKFGMALWSDIGALQSLIEVRRDDLDHDERLRIVRTMNDLSLNRGSDDERSWAEEWLWLRHASSFYC